MNCYQWGSYLPCETPTKELMELTMIKIIINLFYFYRTLKEHLKRPHHLPRGVKQTFSTRKLSRKSNHSKKSKLIYKSELILFCFVKIWIKEILFDKLPRLLSLHVTSITKSLQVTSITRFIFFKRKTLCIVYQYIDWIIKPSSRNYRANFVLKDIFFENIPKNVKVSFP